MIESSSEQSGIALVLENLSDEGYEIVMADLRERMDASTLIQFFSTVSVSLRDSDRPLVRVVVTGDLVASVHGREDRKGRDYTLERGAGMVAAKTMPPNDDGVVDILVHALWIIPPEDPTGLTTRDELMQHTAAHEAVHASLHLNADNPFDAHKREELGYATATFVSMASEQVEEHLAEFLSSQMTGRRTERTQSDVSSSIAAWHDTLVSRLPAIPEDDPDYIEKGIQVTFGALQVLWISLAYLAAALRRDDDGFDAVPKEISTLPEWAQFIGPWWGRYVELLGEIPMTIDVDLGATDKVVLNLAHHLQRWADDLGFDFHDVAEGGGFFRIKY